MQTQKISADKAKRIISERMAGGFSPRRHETIRKECWEGVVSLSRRVAEVKEELLREVRVAREAARREDAAMRRVYKW